MKTASLFDKVEKIMSHQYLCALKASPEEDALFRTLVDVRLDGTTKPLLMVGTTHPRFGDGSCIAVLNPDERLLHAIIPGCGYSSSILKWMVSGKSDLALQLWINTNLGFRTTRGCQYKSRHPFPPRVPWRAEEIGKTMNRPK